MSFDNDERQHRLFPLRLAIKLHRDNEVLDADIINASETGCLLLSAHPLEPGQIFEASIPELLIPKTRLHILRCHSTPQGYMVAADFDTTANEEEENLAWRSEEPPPTSAQKRWLN